MFSLYTEFKRYVDASQATHKLKFFTFGLLTSVPRRQNSSGWPSALPSRSFNEGWVTKLELFTKYVDNRKTSPEVFCCSEEV